VSFGDVSVKRCCVDWAAATEKAADRSSVEKFVHCRLLQFTERTIAPGWND
jgi:hypothetical protein